MGEGVEVLEPGTVAAEALLTRVAVALALGRWSRVREEGEALLALAQASARGRGPFEVAIGEGLEELELRGGLATLGRSGVGDVGEEDLGLTPGYARRLRRDAALLRRRPCLRAAVLAGAVTLRKAEVVLSRTRPADDAYWTERAKVEPVSALVEATRAAGARGAVTEPDWHLLQLGLPPGEAAVVKLALEVSRILQGGGASPLRQMEAVLMEYLSSFPLPVHAWTPTLAESWGPGLGVHSRPAAADVGRAAGGGGAAAPAGPEVPSHQPAADVERAAAGPGEASTRAEAGAPARPAREAADVGHAAAPFDAYQTVARLQALVRQRAAVDETLRRCCLLVKRSGAFQLAGYPSFDAWASEDLGLPPRTVRHLVHLQRALDAHPRLAEAVRAGTLTEEKALHVSKRASTRLATPEALDALIAEAASLPAAESRRKAAADADERDRQMWDAGRFRMSLPRDVASLFQDALASGRAAAPGKAPGEVLVELARHFLCVWAPTIKRLARHPSLADGPDLGPCTVPACTRAAVHLHHVWWQSHGGVDEEWNLVPVCAVHHHRCIHGGTVAVFGWAPGELRWFVGAREVARARALGFRHGRPPWEQPWGALAAEARGAVEPPLPTAGEAEGVRRRRPRAAPSAASPSAALA